LDSNISFDDLIMDILNDFPRILLYFLKSGIIL